MKIVKTGEVPKIPHRAPLFTAEVFTQTLLPESGDFTMNIVNFGKGVRNKFHSHTHEQVLIVLSGEGIVATEEELQVVGVGDIVMIPAGEKHWHGATESSDFSHIYLVKKESRTTQIEK